MKKYRHQNLFSLCLIFFITSCIDKTMHNAVFQHIPTEIDDVVITNFKTVLLFEVSDEGKNGWIVFIMR
jgi:hypothetical protein